MSYIQDISCATCHGLGTQNLWENLMAGVHSPSEEDGTFQFRLPNWEEKKNYKDHFKFTLLSLMENWSFEKGKNVGLIFGSTKGLIEDTIWQDKFDESFDPFAPLINDIQKELPIQFSQTAIVSNACTSSHGALELAQRWIHRKTCDEVLVIGGDLIGPFTRKGFTTLRALSPKGVARPFDTHRDGLILGDGMAAVRLSRKKFDSPFKLNSVFSLCEGISATRPDISGKNLAYCYEKVLSRIPELVITHGTGTLYNDQTESQALLQIFHKENFPKITCSKWSIGHSLGASGLIDLCLAVKALEHQGAPGIATLESSDLEIAPFLLKKSRQLPINSLLISSLGFGGMCSALEVQMEPSA